MVCCDTLGPDTISLICPGNVHYVHWLKQVVFSTSTKEHLILVTK